MNQEDVNEIISKSCPDWKAEQIRHGNGYYNQPINKRGKLMKKKTIELLRKWVVAEINKASDEHELIEHDCNYDEVYHKADEKFEEFVEALCTDLEDDN